MVLVTIRDKVEMNAQKLMSWMQENLENGIKKI